MFLHQFNNAFIGHSSYYFESDGVAAVVDPEWDCSPYLNLAKERKARIDYVFLTRIQDSYISGHSELAEKTGCKLVVGTCPGIGFDAHFAKDEEVFRLGKHLIQILSKEVIAAELCCYLLYDEAEYPFALFSGDVLTIPEDEGYKKSENGWELNPFIEQQMNLVTSKIMSLPDYVLVLPNKAIRSKSFVSTRIAGWNTLGKLKDEFPELMMDKQDFWSRFYLKSRPAEADIESLVCTLNKRVLPHFEDVLNHSNHGLSPAAIKLALESGVIILDFRDTEEFGKGFIKGAIHVGKDRNMEYWIRRLVPSGTSLLIVSEPGTELEIISRLLLIGYTQLIGYLDGGMDAWLKVGFRVDQIDSYSWEELKLMDENEQYIPLDVRTNKSWQEKQLLSGLHIPLEELNYRWKELSREQGYAIVCSDGYRSMIAASYLKSKAYTFIVNIKGGIAELSSHLLKFAHS